jgi:hypothetical protein
MENDARMSELLTREPIMNIRLMTMTHSIKYWLEEEENKTEERSKFLTSCIMRTILGSWGDLEAEDIAANDAAMLDGARTLSAYKHEGVKLWVFSYMYDQPNLNTRSRRIEVMFPEDY